MSSEAEFLAVIFFLSVYYSSMPKIVIWAKLLAGTSELSDSEACFVFIPFLRGSWVQNLNSLKSDFRVRFLLMLAQNSNFGLNLSSDIKIERLKSLFFYHF